MPEALTAENAGRWARAYVGQLLGRPAEEIDLYRPLSEYGLDSVDAVVMAGEMEEHFGVEVDPATFLREATLGELIAELGSPRGLPGGERS
jgi:acyl carrier protein